MISEALFSSEGSNYVLPEDVVTALHNEFKFTGAIGGVTKKLDVPRLRANRAMEERWGRSGSRFIVNPTDFGASIIPWLNKAVLEATMGVTSVVHCPVRTDTSWFALYGTSASEIRLLKGRIRSEGTPTSAPFPSMFLVFRAGDRHSSRMNVSLWSHDGDKLA